MIIKYIFAVSQTKRVYIHEMSVAIFMAILLVLVSAKIKESSIHNGLLHSCFSFSWSRCGEMTLFFYIYLIIHYMTKRSEKVSKVNNSTLTSASVHDTDKLSFSDLFAALQSKFNIEKDAKNQAYAYILSRGLLKDFAQFSKYEVSGDPFSDCIDVSSLCVTDNN